MSAANYAARGRRAVVRAVAASRAALVRRDSRAVLGGVTVLYLALYLFAVGHLRPGTGGFDLFVVGDPLSRMFRTMGTLSFEPIALVDVGPLTFLFAPVNVAIGLVLAGLVGVNLAVSYLAWKAPAACGIDRDTSAAGGSGLLAGLPALLSGAACCGPVVLIAVGVQASAALITAFGFLVPLAVVLLVASLLYVARSVDPNAARAYRASRSNPGSSSEF